jgi:pimeloyl-ACP methyl ester carboxylesterase
MGVHATSSEDVARGPADANAVSRRLSPEQVYPAGVAGVSSRFIRTPTGLRLRIAESGPPGGRPVILLHGWGASLYGHRFLLEQLARLGMRAAALDFRGHGSSDKPTGPGLHTRDALIADVIAAMNALGVERADVVGHSMGGAVAFHLALTEPERVRRVVLINPAGFAPLPLRHLFWLARPRLIDRLARVGTPRWLFMAILRAITGDPSCVTARDVDEYWAPSRDPGYFAAARALLCEFEWRPARPEELARFRHRTLVVLGEVDRLVTGVGPVAERLPDARVAVIPGAGHICHEERSDQANDAIVRFLEAPESP